MKPPVFEYVAVRSTEEALGELVRPGEDARLLAGGHSLMAILNSGSRRRGGSSI